jgi:glycine oxidase
MSDSDRPDFEPVPAPAAGTREAADIAVIGAGVVGLACAWRLAAGGADVVVVDAGAARPAATRVAAGMIAPSGEASWGEEGLLAAALESARLWPGWAEELSAAAGLEVPYRRCGSLHVALDRDEAAELRRRAELHVRLGLPTRAVMPSEARRLEPGLATSVAAAIEAPEEAEIDPRALLAALGAAAEAAGVRRIEAPAERCEPGSGRVELAAGGVVEAGRVVVATGAWAGEGLLPDGLRPPVRPVKGEILRLRGPASALPCERIVVGERFYVVPRENGEVVVGATVAELGFDLRVTAGGVHELLREAYRALPELAELELVESAAGLRPGTPDNAPIVGELAPGLLFAGGLYRNGILLAPLIGETVAALAAGTPPPAEAAALAPGRFDAGAGAGAEAGMQR